ncbi:hypothetical protein ACQP1K_08285 [Sphaerimonospora sp. CA-214678]|uniref:hypothetical protein n=1 Tax=Sphaerimonospora sp. CA-214678 TaxID=3240029 RepID=UPI003D90AE89
MIEQPQEIARTHADLLVGVPGNLSQQRSQPPIADSPGQDRISHVPDAVLTAHRQTHQVRELINHLVRQVRQSPGQIA